ncbi:hypothetical protein CUJ84_pRLN3000158 (plasmid) [Rhizobium leguminosarum]|uniref:Uncharacterized protein n=1 Tax=Rhizobium leguminosarum TaxID=384 RepID=A0A2K9ZGA7_RHILE|nr:hypothetical protein CUJ84_pRLN3000158 [Rhizobium leguminosarum]
MSDHHDQTSSKVRLTQFWMLIDSVERLAQTIERRQEVELLLEDAERQIGTAEEVSEGRHRRDEIDHELEEKTVVLGDEIALFKNTRRALRTEERGVREQLRSSVDMGPGIAEIRAASRSHFAVRRKSIGFPCLSMARYR